MKITSLEPQKKQGRLNLYVDGSFYCGIDLGTAARLGFYEGKLITEIDLNSLDSEEEYQKCMNHALNLASRRHQSEREYWQKLGPKFEKPVIGRVIERLRILGYADDQKFAEMWVRERSKTRGRKLLSQELKIKGVDKQIIEDLLSGVASESELEAAITIASRKYKLEGSRDENFSRILGLLTRKGYSYQISKKAFEKVHTDIASL